MAADMSGLILGPPGSRVTLGFQTDTVPSRFYQVRSVRIRALAPCFLSLVHAALSD